MSWLGVTSTTVTAPRRTRIVVALMLAACNTLLGVLVRPRQPTLSTMMIGDVALAARVRPYLQGAVDRVSVATIDGDTVLFRRNMQRSTASDYVCRANLPVTVLFWLHATSQPTRSGMTNVARTRGLTVLVKSTVVEGA